MRQDGDGEEALGEEGKVRCAAVADGRIDPWGSELVSDYEKLFTEFGLKYVDENLLSRIGQMEKRKEELESMLADPRTYGDANQARSAGSEYREIAPILDALYQQWSVVQEKIDAIEQEMTEAGEL